MNRRELTLWLTWGALLALTVVAYENMLSGEFTYDDKVEVVGNRTLRFLDEWRLVLAYNWSRPVLIATYALNYRLAGLDPWPYHVVDLTLQGLNAGLALLLGLRIFGDQPGGRLAAAGSAALWAVHPLNTEAVSYVTGRSEQLAGGLMLLACLGFVSWRAEGGLGRLALCAVATALAFFTKEVAVVLPVAFVLLEWLAVRRGALGQVRWGGHLLWLVALGAFFALRLRVYGVITTDLPDLRPRDVQLFTQAEVIWRYVQLAVLPVGQSVFHDHPATGLTARSALAMAGVLGAGIGALAAARRAPLVSLGVLWWLLCLAPSSSFVPLKETMAEHRPYLALLGLCWIAAEGLRRLPGSTGVALLVTLCAVEVGLTRSRNTLWQTEVALWGDAVKKNPASAEAWYGYGDALRFKSELAEAATAYKRARELNPTLLDATNNLGLVQAQLGQRDEAEATWRALLLESPTYCKAHNNLGLLYAREGRPREAAAELRTTLAYCPDDCRAHRYLGELYGMQLNDRQKAVLHLEVFLELCPADRMSEDARALLNKLTW
ncbi:tetratricopeptide repeat protein [Myxococcota bacterium]|nr:tetratricopeptide repeat protein [Myxococcota bacterium]